MRTLQITPGMANKFASYSDKIKFRCDNCTLSIPVYKGKYPVKCPSCSGGLYSVEESSLDFYYPVLLEYFIKQEDNIQRLHTFSTKAVAQDLLRFNTMPMLCALRQHGEMQELFEGWYAITHPSFRKSSFVAQYLLEQAVENFNESSQVLLGLKTAGLFTDVFLNENIVEEVKNASILLLKSSPEWLEETTRSIEATEIESYERKTQILAESFVYANLILSFNFNEAVEFAKEVLKNDILWLNEGLWQNDRPPGLVTNPVQQKGISWSSGGFRFRLNKDNTLQHLQNFQKKILSHRNNKAGLASRIASIRQIIQRKRALNKANQWHKASPYSGLLHKGLGQLLHRTSKQNEGCLRVFHDGSDYFTGTVLSFKINNNNLLEQQIKKENTYVLKKDVITASSNKELPNRILKNEEIKIISITPAKSWKGDYPSPPMGQFIYDVEVLTGEKKGEYYELDSVDLADSLGIDEGIRFTTFPFDGGIFLHKKNNYNKASLSEDGISLAESSDIDEIVISSFDFMLTEGQIGAINRKIQKHFGKIQNKCILRNYNDVKNVFLLFETICLSQFSGGRKPYYTINNMVLFEASPEYSRIVNKYKQQIEKLKRDFIDYKTGIKGAIQQQKEELERATALFKQKLAELAAERAKELANLKTESVNTKIYIRGNLC